MMTLSTQITDGLHEDELYETLSGLKEHQWSHSITLGVAGNSITYGDVWMSVQQGLSKMMKIDEHVRYALWICKNIQSDGSEGRPHAHGVIFTNLLDYRIKACFYSYGNKSYRTEKIVTETALKGWFHYFLPQAVRDTVLTNISTEVYA